MSDSRYRDLFQVRGFQPFVWTQFLGALNDNLYKQIVSLAVASGPRLDESSDTPREESGP